MSAVDLNGSVFETAGRIESWTRDWELGEHLLRCRHCVGFQALTDAAGGVPFTAHTPECTSVSRGEQYPLHVLRTVLGEFASVTP
jgi:hypothetical protein